MNSIEDFLKIIASLKIDSNGCKIWNRSKDNHGYGYYCIGGRNRKSHRLLFQLKFPGNYQKKVIRHKCDNPSCCNIDHLEAGSQADNIRDMIARKRAAIGSKMPTSKLNEIQVLQIKKRLKNQHTKDIAKDFGVANTTIAAIKNGRTWKDVAGGSKRENFRTYSRMQRNQTGSNNLIALLDEVKVKEIKIRLRNGETAKSIASDFSVHKNTIFAIKQNRTWKHVD